jgi:putative membrane protein
VRTIRWSFILVIAILLADFAISNRQPVEVKFWPLPVDFSTRLFFAVLVSAAFGFILGELVAWFGGRRWRQEVRVKQRRIEALERELAATQAQLKSTGESAGGAPRSPGPPATH